MATQSIVTRGAETGGGWSRNLVQNLAGATVLFLVIYSADLVLSQNPAWLAGPPGAPEDPLWRPWAYVPTGDLSAVRAREGESGQAVGEGSSELPRLERNDLHRRVVAMRRKLQVAVEGVMQGGAPCAPLRALAPAVGGEVRWAGQGKATVYSRDGVVEFIPWRGIAQRNFRSVTLPAPPFVAGQDFYVPLQSLAKVYAMKYTCSPDGALCEVSRDGQVVRVLLDNRAFRIEIDRSDRWLKVFYAGQLAKSYRACTGQGENTPVGEFHIQNRAVWPGWRAYWGEYIPGGSSRNPLGARFLGTSARGRRTGWTIGIHGTNQPSSIGQRISGGCVRLMNEHAIELYEVIPRGTRVSIHE